MRKSKATLHDVAAAAGVSIATASKALNGVAVSKANHENVARAAAKVGYIVNETARALRSNRSFTVGLIFNELTTTRGLGLLDSMSGALEAAGYSLICATARADADAYDVLMRRFLERRVDGLFCVTPPASLPSVSRYRAAGIPIVAVTERSEALLQQPLVRPSITEAARAALTDIVKLGHRHVLSIDDGSTGLSLKPIDPRWTEQIEIELIRLSDTTDLHEFVLTIANGNKRPTLISAFAPQAEAIINICRAAGIKTPGALSIIALTQSASEKRAQALGLSSVFIRPESLGANAAKQMIDLLNDQKVKKDISVEVGSWHLRASVGAAN